MIVNRDGVTRTVFLIGRYAVKVATLRYGWRFFLRGLLSNLNERDVWGWSGIAGWEATRLDRSMLARVAWCSPGGFVLVMERADRTLTDEEFARVPAEMRWVDDLKADNVGVFGAAWRVIDYGEGWTPVEAEHERRGNVPT